MSEKTPDMSAAVAANLVAARKRARLSQEDVALALRSMGHETWSRATVSQTERGKRPVRAVELLHLALALHTDLVRLFDPTPVTDGDVRLGAGRVPAPVVRAWALGAITLDAPEPGQVRVAPVEPPPSLYREQASAFQAMHERAQRRAHAQEQEERGRRRPAAPAAKSAT